MTQDEYFAELDAAAEAEAQLDRDAYIFGGGYEASKGDYEGAAIARADWEWGGDGGMI